MTMTDSTSRATTPTSSTPATPRLQLTMLDEAATFIRDYSERNDLTSAEAVRRGLQLLRLVDELSRDEHLAVVNEAQQTLETIELPWRIRVQRSLPTFGRRNTTRRPRHQSSQLTSVPD